MLAEDAVVAGRMLLRQKPDLIIVDAYLPYLSGVDLVATLLADATAPIVPAFFITDREDMRVRAQTLGRCLMKPFSVPQLLRAVAEQFGAPAPRVESSPGFVAAGRR